MYCLGREKAMSVHYWAEKEDYEKFTIGTTARLELNLAFVSW